MCAVAGPALIPQPPTVTESRACVPAAAAAAGDDSDYTDTVGCSAVELMFTVV